jgi:hypothetical protein
VCTANNRLYWFAKAADKLPLPVPAAPAAPSCASAVRGHACCLSGRGHSQPLLRPDSAPRERGGPSRRAPPLTPGRRRRGPRCTLSQPDPHADTAASTRIAACEAGRCALHRHVRAAQCGAFLGRQLHRLQQAEFSPEHDSISKRSGAHARMARDDVMRTRMMGNKKCRP